MEDLRLTATAEGHFQCLQTEFRVKAASELPAENISGEQIYDWNKEEESLLQWVLLISVAQSWFPALTYVSPTRQGNRPDGSLGTVVLGFWSFAYQTLVAHEVTSAIVTDRDAFSGHILDHPAISAVWIARNVI